MSRAFVKEDDGERGNAVADIQFREEKVEWLRIQEKKLQPIPHIVMVDFIGFQPVHMGKGVFRQKIVDGAVRLPSRSVLLTGIEIPVHAAFSSERYEFQFLNYRFYHSTTTHFPSESALSSIALQSFTISLPSKKVG